MNPKKLTRKILPKKGIKLAEEGYRKARIGALQTRHGFPAKDLRVIAVTGTNGKTTACCYINSVLKAGGYKTALFTTAVIELNGETQLNRTHRTVPLTAEFVAFLKKAKQAKVDFLVLEVTSQALDQHKTLGIPVEIAVMTNLTQDHLDYHGTMDAYAEAKAKLFNRYKKPKYSVLNHDDKWFEYFRKESVGKVVTYGKNKLSDYRIIDIKLSPDSSNWDMTNSAKKVHFTTVIPGEFNVYNASIAATVGQLLGMEETNIRKGLDLLKAVPGRMETVDAGQDFTIIVDYAHTPDALKNVLGAAKQLTKGRVIAVYGATGDRDKTKRPLMGEIGAKLADIVVLTDDETYTEDGDTIRASVREGIEEAEGKFVEIADRREAIRNALSEAQKGDVVVLCGIGHQNTRNMGGKLVPWDERQVVLDIMNDHTPR